MRLGSETGSLINHLMARGGAKAEVGMGATILSWTDRHPATIVKVTASQVHVQRDNYKRIDNNGMSECQEYEYTPNPNASVEVFRVTKKGLKNKSGNYLSIGEREKYYDFSF